MSDTKKLIVPGFVYHEILDPLTTDVPGQSGWPTPTRRRVGRGAQYIYELTPEQYDDVLEHIGDFAEAISYGVDDPSVGRRMARWLESLDS